MIKFDKLEEGKVINVSQNVEKLTLAVDSKVRTGKDQTQQSGSDLLKIRNREGVKGRRNNRNSRLDRFEEVRGEETQVDDRSEFF